MRVLGRSLPLLQVPEILEDVVVTTVAIVFISVLDAVLDPPAPPETPANPP